MDISYSSEALYNSIISVTRLFQRRAKGNDKALGSLNSVSDRDRLLIILSRFPDGLREYELAEKANITRSTVSILLKALKDYIQKTGSKDDERCKIITLTKAGIQRAEEISSAWSTYIEDCFAGLSEEDRVNLAFLLNKMIKHNSAKLHPIATDHMSIRSTDHQQAHYDESRPESASIIKPITAVFLSTSPDLDKEDEKFLPPKNSANRWQFDDSYKHLNPIYDENEDDQNDDDGETE